MPRRGGGFRSSSPKPSAPMRKMSPPPAAPSAAAAPQRQGPGLMGQMAATAGGVAIGSALGHAVGNMFGGFGGERTVETETVQQPPAVQNQPMQQPCEFELRQLLDCSDKLSDLSLCQAFNDALRECRSRYAI